MPINPLMNLLTIDSIKTLAQRMNFVSFDTLQVEDQSVQSHWFRHEDGLDIYYFQKSDGRFIKLHISILGLVIEWNPMDGTRTGLMVEQEHGGEVFETVHYDVRANNESVAQSLVILENASCISEPLRQELAVLLKHSDKITAKSSQKGLFARIISRFR